MTPASLALLHAQALQTPRPWSAAEFARFLSDPAVLLIARPPHAFALGRVVVDEAELLTLAVDPTMRRAGLGHECLAGFEALARDRGAATAFLEVAADNLAAIALYRGRGYRQTGMRRGYYTAPDGSTRDALTMARALP